MPAGQAPALQPDEMPKDIAAIFASALVLSVTHTGIAQYSHHQHPPSVGTATSGAAGQTEHEHPAAHGSGAAGEQAKTQKYTCVMHPEVISDHPGNCPKCGMKLVPVAEKKRPTPINREQASHSDKSRASAQHSTPKVGAIDPNHPSHEHHPPPSVAAATSGTAHDHEHERMQMGMEMHSTINVADPMSREGSGTSWIPDSSPMYGRMFMFGENMLMLHGAIFPRYTNVSTRRGDDRIDAPNWFMGMYSRPLWDNAQFGSRLMMSLDPSSEER